MSHPSLQVHKHLERHARPRLPSAPLLLRRGEMPVTGPLVGSGWGVRLERAPFVREQSSVTASHTTGHPASTGARVHCVCTVFITSRPWWCALHISHRAPACITSRPGCASAAGAGRQRTGPAAPQPLAPGRSLFHAPPAQTQQLHQLRHSAATQRPPSPPPCPPP